MWVPKRNVPSCDIRCQGIIGDAALGEADVLPRAAAPSAAVCRHDVEMPRDVRTARSRHAAGRDGADRSPELPRPTRRAPTPSTVPCHFQIPLSFPGLGAIPAGPSGATSLSKRIGVTPAVDTCASSGPSERLCGEVFATPRASRPAERRLLATDSPKDADRAVHSWFEGFWSARIQVAPNAHPPLVTCPLDRVRCGPPTPILPHPSGDSVPLGCDNGSM